MILEAFVAGLEEVEGMQTLIGGGGVRYMQVYSLPAGEFVLRQSLTRVDDYTKIDDSMPTVRDFIAESFPNAQTKV